VTEIVRGGDAITVADRWSYVWGHSRRPLLHPVTTPAGHVLTRDAPDDHPWHHGLWFTIKFVNKENFWEEYDAYGVLRHRGEPEVVEHGDGRVSVLGTLQWIRPDRESVAVTERRLLTHVPLATDGYAIDLDTTLVAAVDTTYDRTPFTTWGGYGGLTVRGPGDWVDTSITLSDGSTHDRVLGTSARWFDLTGTVTAGATDADGGGEVAGIALFDHPGNRRHPCPVYASTRADTYGDEGWSNFANLAFLWDGPLWVAAGEELRVRHRTIVHDGRWSAERLDDAWRQWSAEG
jgi:hypothetical protein